MLYHFDSGNFALAHLYFHPGLSRPHLPGDPLYVGLSHLLAMVTPTLQDALTVSGILAAAGALTFLFLLAEQTFGRRAAMLSSGLLFVSPALFTGGLTNPVRVFLALITCAGAWFGWQVLTRRQPRTPLLAGAASMGLLCGFRPEMLVLAAPLLFVPALLRRQRWPLVAAIALFLATAAPWQAFTIWRTGGGVFEPSRFSDAGERLDNYLTVTRDYLTQQSQRDSTMFGAGAEGGFSLLAKAVVWTFYGILPALLLVLALRLWRSLDRSHLLLFGLWFLPCFLFHAVVHIADPDHALSTIPALCWLAGRMLASWVGGAPSGSAIAGRQWAAWGTVAACGALFLLPNPRITEQASYPRIREQAVRGEALVASLFDLQRKSRLAIFCHDAEYPWRNLNYYFSGRPLVYFPQAPSADRAPGSSSADPHLYVNSFRAKWEMQDGRYVVRNADMLIWPLSLNREENRRRESEGGFGGHYVLLQRPVTHNETFSIGRHHFVVIND